MEYLQESFVKELQNIDNVKLTSDKFKFDLGNIKLKIKFNDKTSDIAYHLVDTIHNYYVIGRRFMEYKCEFINKVQKLIAEHEFLELDLFNKIIFTNNESITYQIKVESEMFDLDNDIYKLSDTGTKEYDAIVDFIKNTKKEHDYYCEIVKNYFGYDFSCFKMLNDKTFLLPVKDNYVFKFIIETKIIKNCLLCVDNKYYLTELINININQAISKEIIDTTIENFNQCIDLIMKLILSYHGLGDINSNMSKYNAAIHIRTMMSSFNGIFGILQNTDDFFLLIKKFDDIFYNININCLNNKYVYNNLTLKFNDETFHIFKNENIEFQTKDLERLLEYCREKYPNCMKIRRI